MTQQPLDKRAFLIFCLLALSICAARFLFFYIRFLDNPSLPIDPDSLDYIEPARSLLESRSYTFADGQPAFRRPPGYPALLAMIWTVFGNENLLAVIIVQNVAFFGTAIIVIYLSLILSGRRAAAFAGILILTHFTSFYYVNEVLNETVYTLLLSAGLLCLILCLLRERRWIWLAFASGLILSAAAFVRPVGFYYFYPATVVVVIYSYWKFRNWRPAASAGIAFLLPWVLLGGLWCARNQEQTGKFQFVGQQNEILHERTLRMIARFEGIPHYNARKYYPKYLASRVPTLKDHLTFYLSHPGEYLALSAEAVLVTLFSPGQWHFKSYFPYYRQDRPPLLPLIFKADFPGLFEEFGRANLRDNILLIGILGHSALLAIGAIFGVIFLFNLGQVGRIFITFGLITMAYFLAMVFVWGGGTRFGVPMVPVQAILAGIGIGGTLGWGIDRKNSRQIDKSQ